MANVYDYVRAAAFLIGFMVLAFQNVNTWMIVDGFMAAVFGVACIVVPVMNFDLLVTGVRIDPLHVYFLREIGCTMVATAVLIYLIRNSKDRNVIKTVLCARTLALAVYTVRAIYGQWKFTGIFTSAHVWTEVYASAVLLVVSSIQLVRYGMDLNGRNSGSKVNRYFLYDTILTGVVAAIDILIPFFIFGFMNTRTDNLHQHVFASLGCMNLSAAFITWFARAFRFNEDKRAVIYFRVTALSLILVCLLYGKMVEGLLPDVFDFIFVLLGCLPLSFHAGGFIAMRDRKSSSSAAGYNLRDRN
ncbi:uncharacterized protein LOC126824095 [Patella vulgata]|uniref:uncharacterized protein LOC126824095 n=1 Tax=Patella vulgata TaxID=6465 RepID=UPI00217FA8CB|nr:uncharacterized protein LOC126824095 [Patella vulgata]